MLFQYFSLFEFEIVLDLQIYQICDALRLTLRKSVFNSETEFCIYQLFKLIKGQELQECCSDNKQIYQNSDLKSAIQVNFLAERKKR